MKRMVVFFVFLFFLLNLTSASALPRKRYDSATQSCRILTFSNSSWASEGNEVFRNYCKVCHYNGNDQGAPFLHAESKTMKAWNRVFAKRYPECARNGSWAALSQEEILKLNDFLYRNAWGTYDPYDAESCG